MTTEWFIRIGIAVMVAFLCFSYRHPEQFNWPFTLPLPVFRAYTLAMIAFLALFFVVTFFVDFTR